MLKITLVFYIFFLTGCSLNQKYNVEAANINAKLGLVYLQQGRVELAKTKLLIAIKQAPYDAKVNIAFGDFFAYTGERDLAEKHYLCAIKQANENGKGIFWHSYGSFLYQQGRYVEALGYFLLAAKDVNYLFVAKAYADADYASLKLKQDSLARKYRLAAISHDPNIYEKS